MKTQNTTIAHTYVNKNWYGLLERRDSGFKMFENIKIMFKRLYKVLEIYGASAGEAIRK